MSSAVSPQAGDALRRPPLDSRTKPPGETDPVDRSKRSELKVHEGDVSSTTPSRSRHRIIAAIAAP